MCDCVSVCPGTLEERGPLFSGLSIWGTGVHSTLPPWDCLKYLLGVHRGGSSQRKGFVPSPLLSEYQLLEAVLFCSILFLVKKEPRVLVSVGQSSHWNLEWYKAVHRRSLASLVLICPQRSRTLLHKGQPESVVCAPT